MGQSVKEALNQGPTQFIATPPHYVGAHCNHCGLSGQATAVHLRKTGGLRVYGPLTDTYVPKVFLLAYCRAAAFLGSHPAQVLYSTRTPDSSLLYTLTNKRTSFSWEKQAYLKTGFRLLSNVPM